MQGFKLRTHAVSCFLLALSSTMIATCRADVPPSAAEIMNQTCQIFPDGYIGNPFDCTAWGYCENNQLVKQGNCDDGQNYEKLLGECVWAGSSSCIDSVQEACQSQISPIYVADPTSCSDYAYCDGEGGYTAFTCPGGQYFDSSVSQCTYANPCATGNICALVPNGAFLADPEKCGNYIQCISGSAGTTTPCADSRYFNSITGKCQTQYPCDYVNDDDQICSSFTDGGPNLIADSLTCYGYFTCTSTTGPGVWNKCPFGTHFDQTSQSCVSPASFACGKNRCGNLDLEFVTNVATTGCADYNVCNNQQTVGDPTACTDVNPKFPYFDEIAQKCVDVALSYAIC